MARKEQIDIILKPITDLKDVSSGVKEIESLFKGLDIGRVLGRDLETAFARVKSNLNSIKNLQKSGETDSATLGKTQSAYRDLNTNIERIVSTIRKANDEDLSKMFELDFTNQINQIKKLEEAVANAEVAISTAKISPRTTTKIRDQEIGKYLEKHGSSAKILQGDIFKNLVDDKQFEKALEHLRNFRNGINNITDDAKKVDAKALYKTLSEPVLAAKNANDEYEKSQERLKKAEDSLLKAREESGRKAKQNVEEFATGAGKYTSKVEETLKAQQDWNKEMDQMKSRVAHFFGLANAINLVQRTLRSAVQTVKELDAVMTEVAVVTDFTVGDMWRELPKYTERANTYGLAIKDVYEADMLYYQQGLSTNEVMSISNETLKVARIAGLETADATDRMTNALRGFNMEINESSALNIADVYSELAATSASNVDELSIAMTKTASLAHSANMTFENTAAILTQIIETTREAPETAGTALKTIIARFSEVKNLFSKDELMGTDEEGEIIDVNRISKALRIAGIDLNEYFTEQVGLDEIFFQLAEKWDSLEEVQQRYIATTAAGARQQSRFIAMMQDQNRLMEFTESANNAAGASARQYEKTQESLMTTLNRLKNAWDRLTMGIADSSLIKTSIKALTGLINLVNLLTDGVDGFGASVMKIMAGFTALKLGKSLFDNLFHYFKHGSFKEGVQSGSQFIQGFKSVQAGFGQKLIKGEGETGRVKSLTSIGKADLQVADGEELAGTYDKMGLALGRLSKTALITGVSLTAFSSVLSKMGYEKAAIGIKAVGTGIMAVAGALAIATPIMRQFNIALSGGKVGLFALAIGAVVGIVSYFASTIETATQKTERLGIQAEEASERAQKLREAYDSLGESLESMSAQNETIDSLARGTDEWKDSVSSLNQEVLELIEKFNFLAPFLKTSGGRLSIDTDAEGFDLAIEEFKNTVFSAEVAALGAKSIEIFNEIENRLNDAKTEGPGSGPGNTYSKLSDEQYKQLALLLAGDPGTIAGFGDEFKNLEGGAEELISKYGELKELRISTAEEYIESLRSLGFSMLEGQKEIDAYNSAILTSQITKVGKDKNWGEELINQITNAFSPELIQKHQEDVLSEYEGVRKYRDLETSQKTAFNEYWRKQGKVESDGSVLRDGEEEAIGFSEALMEFQANTGIERLSPAIEALSINIKNLPPEIQRALSGIEGKDLGFEDIEELGIEKDLTPLGFIKKYQGLFLQDYKKMTGGEEEIEKALPFGEYLNVIAKAYISAADRYAMTQERLEEGGLKDEDTLLLKRQLSSDSFEQIGDRLLEVITKSGTESTKKLVGALSETFEEIDSENLDKFINELTMTDWSNLAELDELPERLEELGIISSNAVPGVKDLIGEIREAMYAVNSYRVETFQKESPAMKKIIEQAKSTDGTTLSISGDEFDDLMASNEKVANLFSANIDGGYDYIGSMEVLVSALEENTQAQYDSIKDAIEADLKAVGFVEKIEKNMGVSLENYENWGEEEQQAFLENFQKRGKTSKDFDFSKAALGDLTDKTNIQTLNDEERAKILQAILTTIQNKFLLEENEKTIEDEYASRSALTNTAIENALALQGGVVGPYQQELLGRASQVGVGAQYIEQYKPGIMSDEADTRHRDGLALARISDSYSKAGDFGVDTERMAGMAEHLAESFGLDLEDAFQHALSDINFHEGFSKLAEGYDNWVSTLTDGALDDAVKQSLHYKDTILEVNKAFEQMMGAEAGSLPETFFESAENADLLRQAIEGSEIAMNTLQENAARDIFLEATASFNYDGATRDINNFLEMLFDAETQAHLEAYGSIDDRDMLAGLNNMIENANLTQAEVNRLLANMGYEPEIGFKSASSTARVHGSLPVGLSNPEGIHSRTSPGSKRSQIQYASINSSVQTDVQVPYVRSLKKGGSMGRVYPGGSGRPAPRTSGGGGGGSKPKGGGGGSSKADKPDRWTNPYDKLHNLLEKINESMRQREKLERDYDKLLEKRGVVARDVVQHSLDQIEALKREIDLQRQLLIGRRRELEAIGSETYEDEDGNLKTFSQMGVTKYASYSVVNGSVTIDWEGINKITNTETGAALEDYISRLQEIQGDIENIDGTIRDIEDVIKDIRERNKSDYLELEYRLYDAIVDLKQEIIDNYSKLDGTINDSNAKLLSSLKESIELERQIRDNTKIEEDIEERERRLAYMRRDTSGANELEALRLEKEIAESQEEYQNMLIDQAIEQMVRDNNLAAEQRATQINIMQEQLDYQTRIGDHWEEVHNLITTSFNQDGSFNNNSKLVEVLSSTEAFKAMSHFGKKDWAEDLANGWIKAQEGLSNLKIDEAKDEGRLKLSSGESLTYNKSKDTWFDSKGNSYRNVKWDEQHRQFTGVSNKDAKPKPSPSPKPSAPKAKAKPTDATYKHVADVIMFAPNQGGWGNNPNREKLFNEIFGEDNNVQKFINQRFKTGRPWYSNSVKDRDRFTPAAMRKRFPAYKKGGLVDFTGLAWLDGTPSKPEGILSPADTQNFIALRETLSKLAFSSQDNLASNNTYYDIDFGGVELSSDYEFDRMVNKVKKEITEAAGYKNGNLIRFQR